MPLNTFPVPREDKRFFLPNKFGIDPSTYYAIVKTAEEQPQTAIQLTDAANIATDAFLAANFYVTLAGNRNMFAPTNAVSWKTIRYYIIQDAIGSRTMTWDAVFRFSTTIPSPTLTTTAGYSDYIDFIYNPVHVYWDCIRIVKGFQPPP